MSSKIVLRALSLSLFCLLLLASPARAGEAHLYVAPFFQSAQMTGGGRLAGGSVGTDFELEDDLGVDPDEALAGLDAFVKFLGQRVQFSYYQDDITGTETLSQTLVFNGTTFNISEKVRTEMDLKRYEVLYGFDIGLKFVNIGFLGGAQMIDIQATMESSLGTLEQEDIFIPLPVIGAVVGIHPTDKIAIHAKLTGMSANISDFDVSVFDAHLGIDYLFLSKFGVSFGYKAYVLDVTDEGEDNNIDLDQSGPYIGLALHL